MSLACLLIGARKDIGMSRAHRARRAALALIAGLAAAPATQAGSLDLYYERALMSAADSRCRLFTPDIAAALEAASAQARGAALRAGAAEPALQATAAQAQAKAAATACSSPDLRLVADRVRQAFKGYVGVLRMSFPGEMAGWSADRSLPAHTPVWRLTQSAPLGSGVLTFGLAGQWSDPQALVAVTGTNGTGAPYAARLLIRDPARASEPYLNQIRAGSAAKLPLWARTPPRSASLVFEASARGPAAASLSPPGAASAIAFRFPDPAVKALAALDPREAVTVELLYAGRDGDVTRNAYIEVGDFAAGLAFLAAGRR
jgi:hypothetical protein